MSKWVRLKLMKNYRNLGSKNDVKNRPKNHQKMTILGGVQNDQKSSNFDLGDPGPLKWNFLKFCTFLQKLPTFRPPKSTPKKGPIENAIPHK
jgi:hypothetical protein